MTSLVSTKVIADSWLISIAAFCSLVTSSIPPEFASDSCSGLLTVFCWLITSSFPSEFATKPCLGSSTVFEVANVTISGAVNPSLSSSFGANVSVWEIPTCLVKDPVGLPLPDTERVLRCDSVEHVVPHHEVCPPRAVFNKFKMPLITFEVKTCHVMKYISYSVKRKVQSLISKLPVC